LASIERDLEKVVPVIERLDKDHNDEGVASRERDRLRKERREKYGDLARIVGFLVTLVALATGVMALLGVR
jgi:hypothetical protein